MTGEEARQKDNLWTNSIVVYDDGEVSFIWGNYESNPKKTLGMRWNISEGQFKVGYPHTRQHPRWTVMPDVIVWSSLQGLLSVAKQRIADGKDVSDNEKWRDRILDAMKEWRPEPVVATVV